MGLYHRGGEGQKAFHNFLPSLLADAPFHSALYKPPQNNMEHDQLTCQQAPLKDRHQLLWKTVGQNPVLEFWNLAHDEAK